MPILLLEDNQQFVDLIRFTYSEEEFVVFDSIAEALKWTEGNCPRMILVDLGLSDSFGIETLIKLKSISCPKIVVTGNTMLAKQAAKEGAVDYINKNGDIDEVLGRIGFNIEKYKKKPCLRFAPDVFEQIKVHISSCGYSELTLAH